jgi:hypothetical protein
LLPQASKVAVVRAKNTRSSGLHDIARIAAIKRALFAPWCFRRSVAGLQHI